MDLIAASVYIWIFVQMASVAVAFLSERWSVAGGAILAVEAVRQGIMLISGEPYSAGADPVWAVGCLFVAVGSVIQHLRFLRKCDNATKRIETIHEQLEAAVKKNKREQFISLRS